MSVPISEVNLNNSLEADMQRTKFGTGLLYSELLHTGLIYTGCYTLGVRSLAGRFICNRGERIQRLKDPLE